LRDGSTVTLTGAGEPVTFTPPTGHMGNGEVERAMTLASRDLRTAGITNPTPEQLHTALMGGTVTNARGETTSMDGVLALRSEGMGWGQVAHTIGVSPAQSERGAQNSQRAAGSFASIGEGRRTERSTHALSASSDRNQLSPQGTQATAISSSSAVANASLGDRDRDTRQARNGRSTERSSDVARIGARVNSRAGHSHGDRGHSLQQAKDHNDARSVASIGSGPGHGKGHSNASAAGAVSSESAISGPGHSNPGNRSHASKAKGGPGSQGSGTDHGGLHGPGGTGGGSFSASASGTASAGGDVGGGHGGGKGK
jgi:hypothetical protein